MLLKVLVKIESGEASCSDLIIPLPSRESIARFSRILVGFLGPVEGCNLGIGQ